MMRRPTTRGRDGDHLVVCDRSGFTVWASDCVKQWDGLLVYKKFAEPRHPQDFLRARREDLTIRDARPQRRIEDETFVGPMIVEIAEDEEGDNNQYAPMGPLGAFAIGQTDDGGSNNIESNRAGAISITVTSTRRMGAADRIGVILDNGDLFLTSIDEITGNTTLQISTPLPSATSAGNRVFDYTAAT